MIRFSRFRRPFWSNPTISSLKGNALAGFESNGFSAHAALLPQKDEDCTDQSPPPFDSYAYSRLFQDCVAGNDMIKGKAVHCHALKSGDCMDLVAWNTLLNMYVKSDVLFDARRTFDEMPERNIVSFVTLIQGCAQHEEFDEAIRLFLRLHREGHELNPFVFTTILKLLVHMEVEELSWCIHACIYKLGCDSDSFVGTALINAYSVCGLIGDAREVFDGIIEKDMVSWTGMVGGYADNGCGEEALGLFSQMRKIGLKPNNYTLSSLLKACTGLRAVELGKSVHGCAIKTRYEMDFYVGGALLDMYAKCGDIEDARAVFEAIPHNDVILWSFMIARYAQSDQSEEALELFRQMRQAIVVPNQFSFCSVLQACATLKALKLGEQAHCHLVKVGFNSDIFVANALIDVYAKCGRTEDSIKLFSNLQHKTDVTWNTLIVGFTHLGHGEEALRFFHQMLDARERGTQVTYSSVLCACASLAALDQGIQIHCLIVKTLFDDDTTVGNALIDMYAKCGVIRDARKVFDSMSQHDEISWNAMISGYSLHGLGQDALRTFEKMSGTETKPNSITFVGVLSACGNIGLVDQARSYFTLMTEKYGIKPNMEHYTCMVRLLGHAGHLDEAMKFINEIPFEPSIMVWRALLSACIIHKDIELGKVSAQKVLEMEPHDESTHVLLSNLYAAAGRWENVANVRKSMRLKGVKKEPGLSWIEIQSEIHAFTVGDKTHPYMRVINAMLEWMHRKINKVGYVSNVNVVLHDVKDDQKEHFLWIHSERLALAFGLVRTPLGSPIRIIKNLRICPDCHAVIMLVSKIVKREIVVRDMNRFHHFENGICSCGDFW